MTVTIVALALSAMLALFSSQFVDFTYAILSQKVFHRSFSIEKWLPSIASFFLTPAFIVILCNALIFYKYPLRQKIVLLSVLLGTVMLMIVYTAYTATVQHVNSDLGSEIWLGKICAQNHTFWPLDWYYSTEIRLLNTQFFSALGFFLTDNWNTVKAIQSFCTCAVLFFAVWYLLNQLEVKNWWLKFFACIAAICPWSYLAWYVGAGENYYIPHAVMSIVYVATFIKLTCHKESVSHFKALLIFFFVHAFVSGLSSIRYIMIFVFPFALTMIILEARAPDRKAEMYECKGFWIENKSVFYSVSGLILSGFGYVCNNVIFRRLWTFSEWNSISFNHFGETTLRDIFGGLVRMFGYNEGIAVFSPGGIINVLVYIALIMLVASLISALKKNLPKSNQIVLVFFIVTMIFNTFLYIHVDYIARYYYPIIIYVIPILVILLANADFSDLHNYFLGVVWGTLLVTSSFATIQNRLVTDNNKDKYAVTDFLLKNDFDFGYATFGNATVITYISNGCIEMGNLKKAEDHDSHITITSTYDYDTWLTPKHIYSDENHKDKKVFLLVSQDQYTASADLRIFTTGKLVYDDTWYRVYEYENHAAFKNGF